MSGRILALAVASLFAGASGLAAQTTVSANSQITIGTVLYIDVTNPNVTFPAVTSTDFEAGSVAASQTSTLTHKGNVQHNVMVKSATDYMDADLVANDNVKPASDLQLSLDAGTSWSGLTTTDAALVSAAARGSYSKTVNYQMLLNYATDAPDTYRLDFTYTIVAN